MYYPFFANSHDIKFNKDKPKLSRIGKLFVAILLIVIFEGALRKWVSSTLTNPIVLLRDSLAIYGIFWSISKGYLRFRQAATQILWLFTFVFFVWGLLQIIFIQTSPLLLIIGARFWLLYLWFSYAAAVSMSEHDFNFINKTIIFTLLIMTPLAVMQHFLPPNAFINKQVDGDESGIFLVSAGIVRVTGFFSFTLGYTTLLALVTPFVLALNTPGMKLWNKKWIPKVAMLSLGVATIVSGSRGAIIFFFILFFFYVLVNFLYFKRNKLGAALLMLSVTMLSLSLIFYFFSRSVLSNQERFSDAAQYESILGRIIWSVLGEPQMYKNFSLIGLGVGMGTNLAGALKSGERTFLLAEVEIARVILEGGLLGLIFLGLKFIVIVVGLNRSWRIMKLFSNILPLLLWIATTIALLSWSIIGQLTVNALGYLLLGLAIASLRLTKLNKL